jgi:hypothetical protein
LAAARYKRLSTNLVETLVGTIGPAVFVDVKPSPGLLLGWAVVYPFGISNEHVGETEAGNDEPARQT